jgi:hypothetical protein
MNWELIIAIIALLLSIYNFLYNVISKWTRLDIDVQYYKPTKISDKNNLFLLTTFINNSDLPITINKVYLHIDEKKYLCSINKQHLGNVTQKSGNTIKSEMNYYSIPFPLQINNLDSERGVLVIATNDILHISNNMELEILTTRGIIKKKIKNLEEIEHFREMFL